VLPTVVNFKHSNQQINQQISEMSEKSQNVKTADAGSI
jgi:hypothetical protein